MRVLTLLEKENHFNKLDEFVRELNEENPVVQKYGLDICHVCYMMKIDGIYLYYDYPFKKELIKDIDRFNNDLNDFEKKIAVDTDQVLDLFVSQPHGFIYYKYDVKNKVFRLFQMESNIGNIWDKEILQNYLPIVHYASNLTESHLFPVTLSKEEPTNLKEILTIYRPLSLIEDRTVNTSLAISFNIKKDFDLGTINFNDIEDKLVKRIIRFFDSPVLDKVILEQRKLEFLAYQHQINGLYLHSSLQALQTNIENSNLVRLQEIKDDLSKRLNCLSIIHDFLFQQEYLSAGYHINKASNPLLGKSIFQLLSFFDEEANFTGVKIEWKGDTNKLQFCPVITDKDGSFELSEITMLLWNLWLNATESAYKHKSNSIEIEITERNKKLGITFSNKGEIQKKFIEFFKDEKTKYPTIETKRTMKGLEIIKNILIKNKLKWDFKITVSNESAPTTKFTIIFLNLNY